MNQIAHRIAGLVLGAGALAAGLGGSGFGCQRSSGTAAPVVAAYRDDVARICDAVAKSGADRVPAGERALPIATWLAANLQTQEAHDYLVRIQPLTGDLKAAALDTEAHRVGLASCTLAAEWRGGSDDGH